MCGNTYLIIMPEKKLYSSIFILLMLISTSRIGFNVEAIPQTEVYINPYKSVVEVGETFKINVSISDEYSDLYGFEFKLYYNTTILDAHDVALGSFLNPPILTTQKEINDTSGMVWFLASSFAGADPANGNGTLAIITFEAVGEGDSIVDINNVELATIYACPHPPFDVVDGEVRVFLLIGDLNKDGVVNIYDLVSISSFFGCREDDPGWNPNADLAPSYGVINIYDIVRTAKNYGRKTP